MRPQTSIRRAGALALAAALALGACAQAPRSSPPRASTAPTGSALLRELVNDPERVAQATGVPRQHPRFAAVQAGMTRFADDPVVAPWLMRLVREGATGPLLTGFIQQRTSAGLLRLGDDAAADYLALTAAWMGRIPDADCARQLGEIGRGGPATSRRMADLLTDDEMRQQYDIAVRALRADLEQRSARPRLDAARHQDMAARLGQQLKDLQAEPGHRRDACAATADLLATPLQWTGRDRSDGMSFVLQLMTRPQRARPAAPAGRESSV